MATKVAVVTGSTSGIGLAIAHVLLKRKCHVIITGIVSEEEKTAVMKELTSKYDARVEFIPADLRKLSDIEVFCEKALALFPEGIDILVNNAGFNHVGYVSEYPDEKWDDSVAVMLSAPFHLCKRFIPGMRVKGWGRIINISSQMGIAISSPGKAVYSAVKSGQVGLTRGIALEEARNGITCNAICPGFADAPVFQKQIMVSADVKGISYEQGLADVCNKIPTGQLIEPSQLAELVEFLCLSKAGEQITGASHVVDGGFTVQ